MRLTTKVKLPILYEFSLREIYHILSLILLGFFFSSRFNMCWSLWIIKNTFSFECTNIQNIKMW